MVVFLDELPWMAVPKSKLIQALDHVWNTQFSTMPKVILVVCGSAATGGLHNRITRRIRLAPFNLREAVNFLKTRNVDLGLKATTELYLAVGGVPLYLNQVDKRLSASQNIAALCFSENGLLRTEFNSLFRALFGESAIYEKIVRAQATKRNGITRTQLLLALGTESGGSLNRKLNELEEAGFISHLTPYDKRIKNTVYRIIDPYVYFYLSWIERAPGGVFSANGEKYWLEKHRTASYQAWAGYSFENLCLTHAPWVQKALKLDHISCVVGSWNYVPPKGRASDSGTQIDLLFDRSDGLISLCEIKFNSAIFTVDKDYARELKRKIEVFQTITKTRKKIQLVLITLGDFKPNAWSEDLIDIALNAGDIFSAASVP